MTDNQFNQLFDSLTSLLEGIERIKEGQKRMKGDVSELKSDVTELKTDVSELKEGQNRIEKQIRLNNAVVIEIAGEQLRIKSRIIDLEKASV